MQKERLETSDSNSGYQGHVWREPNRAVRAA